MAVIILLVTSLTIFAVYYFLSSKKNNPEKIFGVYSQPGRWFYLKYLTFILILLLKRFKNKLRNELKLRTKDQIERDLEGIQQLSEHDKAYDAIFFQGVSQDGFYLCGGLERRHQGKANGLLYLVIPELGLLESEKLPKTTLNADPVSILFMKNYSAEGLSFTPVKPMKVCQISFNGKMRRQQQPDSLLNVQLELEFRSNNPYFFFERDLNVKSLAECAARERWTKDFFKALKKHEIHRYEQTGYLTGKLKVQNKEYDLKMDSYRDHNFGYKRDWTDLHRYIYHVLYLSNGAIITIAVISHRHTFSSVLTGYVINRDKKIDSIRSSDLNLYQHGENGNPGKYLAFSFTTANKQTYNVQITHNEYEAEHFKGDDIEARLIERFFQCEVNGVKGRGISEWHYNNVQNK